MSKRNLKAKIEWASEHSVDSLTFPIEELEVYARLEAFWHDLVEQFGWIEGAMEMGLDTFCTMAEKHSLIRWEEYDPENFSEEDRDWIEAEPGDPIWFSNLKRDE